MEWHKWKNTILAFLIVAVCVGCVFIIYDFKGKKFKFLNATVSAEKEAVRNYFMRMDEIGSSEEMSGNPQDMASAMAQGATKGDFSSIDDLIARFRGLRGQVQALSVPPPCAEFHRKTLEELNAGIQLYENLKELIRRGDISGLSRLTEQTNRLKDAAKGIEGLKKEILSRYKE